jgi:hypothetical protein
LTRSCNYIKLPVLLLFLQVLSSNVLAQRFPNEALQGKWHLSETKLVAYDEPSAISKTPASGYTLSFNKDTLTTVVTKFNRLNLKKQLDTSVYTYTFEKQKFEALITLKPVDSGQNKKTLLIWHFNSFEIQIASDFISNDSSIFNKKNTLVYTFHRDTNSIHYSILKTLSTKRYYDQSPYADSILTANKTPLYNKKNYSLNTEQNLVVFFPDTVTTTLQFDTSAIFIRSRSSLGARRHEYKDNNDFYRKGYSDRHDIDYQLFYFYPNRHLIEIYILDDKPILFKYKISKSKLTLLAQ